MSGIGNLMGDTVGKKIFNIFLLLIIVFVAKHFLSDCGLKLYKMYYNVENYTNPKNAVTQVVTIPKTKPSWTQFRKLMLQQPKVGLRNSDGDTDTLSISRSSPIASIIPGYVGDDFDDLGNRVKPYWK